MRFTANPWESLQIIFKPWPTTTFRCDLLSTLQLWRWNQIFTLKFCLCWKHDISKGTKLARTESSSISDWPVWARFVFTQHYITFAPYQILMHCATSPLTPRTHTGLIQTCCIEPDVVVEQTYITFAVPCVICLTSATTFGFEWFSNPNSGSYFVPPQSKQLLINGCPQVKILVNGCARSKNTLI